jgi:integrase
MTAELQRSEVVSLPPIARARGGTAFDPRDPVWSFRTGVRSISMNFGFMEDVDDAILPSVKATLLWYVENMAADHAFNQFRRLLHFFRTLGSLSGKRCTRITAAEIMNYRSALAPETTWYLGSMAGAIKRWWDFGYPGIDKDAVQLLNEIRIKGNQKGEAVRTMCPLDGPLSDMEYEGVITGLNHAYAAGSINRGVYLLCWLGVTLGARPGQLAALKICDLVVNQLANGGNSYLLRVPRGKQRNQNARDTFQNRPILPDIGELLELQISDLRSRMAKHFTDFSQAPLFPTNERARTSAPGFEWHFTASEVGRLLTSHLEGLGVLSERTGEAMNMTSTRLRRTLGTRAAMEGHGVLVIAELLDHSDTQNAGVYVEARPETVERIDKALALHMAPLAQAFAGVLVDDSGHEGNRRNPIIDPRFDEGRLPVGTCGMHGFCGLAAPIACYTCRNFQARVDGPHEEVLQQLLTERETLMDAGSARIAAINDRTILAVAEVMRLCDERRGADAEVASA